MSEVFTFYVVDEDALPDDLSTLSDDEKYNVLIAAIESEGMLQSTIEMTLDDLIDGLEALDDIIEGDRLLPNYFMNNSPNNVLDKSADCPYLGFFSAGDAQKIYNLLQCISEDTMDTVESSETHSEVFHSIFAATEAAFDATCALAIIHS
jgi:hypothetical protein